MVDSLIECMIHHVLLGDIMHKNGTRKGKLLWPELIRPRNRVEARQECSPPMHCIHTFPLLVLAAISHTRQTPCHRPSHAQSLDNTRSVSNLHSASGVPPANSCANPF